MEEHRRRRHRSFAFHGAGVDRCGTTVQLDYRLDGGPGEAIAFREELGFPEPFATTDSPQFQRALRGLHIVAGASYYKTECPGSFDLGPHRLTARQAAFFDSVYHDGLAEFVFRNSDRVSSGDLARFVPVSEDADAVDAAAPDAERAALSRRVLLPFGGGKDSILTAQMLREEGHDVTLFRVGPHPLIRRIASDLDFPLVEVERRLSSVLFELNAAGALNGHVPVTAFIAFVALLYSAAHGYDALCMSNEKDADEPNAYRGDRAVNHQWSKTAAFETAFRAHARDDVGAAVEILNPLRALGSVEICAALASRYRDSIALVTSCNTNWRIGEPRVRELTASRWCGRCPKCASAFVSFAPFLDPPEMEELFGRSLVDDPDLVDTYRALLGLTPTKPFECVASRRETAAAFHLLAERPEYRSAVAVEMFLREAASEPAPVVAESQ